MEHFARLPPELLPLIIQNIAKPSHLAQICLISRVYNAFASPFLYERIFIYPWHREAKAKVVQLFQTLATCPLLAQLVLRLEIRDFPLALNSIERADLLDLCLHALGNCCRLRRCTWTRDGALTSAILRQLQKCSELRALTINGHHNGHYDPAILRDFVGLREISIIMPSRAVVDALPMWTCNAGSYLRSLTLICKDSPLVTDAVLESIAEYLTTLEELSLTGCPKVTHAGIVNILSASVPGITDLHMEGVAPNFELAKFKQLCSRSGLLSRLRSISLTTPAQSSHLPVWGQSVADLLAASPLERFHVNGFSGGEKHLTALPDNFCRNIALAHCLRLTRFSIHRIDVSMTSIDFVCRNCPQLLELFVAIERESLNDLAPCLARARRLHTVHINFSSDYPSHEPPVLTPMMAAAIVRQCGSTVRQFGCNTRVWQVERAPTKNDDGEVVLEPYLVRFQQPEIPEQFLVIRA